MPLFRKKPIVTEARQSISVAVALLILLFAGSSAFGQPSPVPSPRPISILDYGAVGNGVANDLPALQAAVSASIASKKPLYIPSGTYQLTFTSPRNGGSEVYANRVNVTGDLKVLGDGAGRTILRCGPDAPSMTYVVFYQQPGSNLSLSDMTIAGPPTPAGNGGQTGPFTASIYLYGGPGKGSTSVSRVNFTGKFNHCINVYNALDDSTTDWTYSFADCDFDSQGEAISLFGMPASRKRAKILDCRFYTTGITAAQNAALGGPSVVYGNSMYVHPNIALHVERCEFYNSVGRALQHYSGGGIPASSPLPWARFVNCYFDDSLNVGVICSPNGFTEFSGCTFRNQSYAINPMASTKITDCVFEANNLGVMPHSGGGTNYGVWISGSRFNTSKTCISSAGTSDPTVFYAIRDCSFTGVNPGGTTIGFATTDQCGVDISHCRFAQSCDTAIRPGSAHVRISECTFTVAQNPAGSMTCGVYALSGVPDVVLSRCTFDRALRFASRNDTNTPLKGVENSFGSLPNAFGGIGGRPYNAGGYDLFASGSGLCPTVLAAASSVAIDPNYDRFRVSGSVPIANLVVGESPGRLTPFGSARVTLIFATAATLATGGNLVPAAPGVRPAGSSATFSYDASTAMWRQAN